MGTTALLNALGFKLLSEAELFNDCSVTVDVVLHQVVEKVTTATNHLEKATTGVVVVLVSLEVFGEIGNSLGEDSDLNFG